MATHRNTPNHGGRHPERHWIDTQYNIQASKVPDLNQPKYDRHMYDIQGGIHDAATNMIKLGRRYNEQGVIDFAATKEYSEEPAFQDFIQKLIYLNNQGNKDSRHLRKEFQNAVQMIKKHHPVQRTKITKIPNLFQNPDFQDIYEMAIYLYENTSANHFKNQMNSLITKMSENQLREQENAEGEDTIESRITSYITDTIGPQITPENTKVLPFNFGEMLQDALRTRNFNKVMPYLDDPKGGTIKVNKSFFDLIARHKGELPNILIRNIQDVSISSPFENIRTHSVTLEAENGEKVQYSFDLDQNGDHINQELNFSR